MNFKAKHEKPSMFHRIVFNRDGSKKVQLNGLEIRVKYVRLACNIS